MIEEEDKGGDIDPRLMQNLLKIVDSAKAEADEGNGFTRLNPEDRARALDLAATLIRQARKEAKGAAGLLDEPEEKPAKPAIMAQKDSDERQKKREILFRGAVYSFKRAGLPKKGDHRVGVVERWETEIEIDDDEPFVLVIEEFVDGRFSPWSFEGVFFKDFVQAAIVGVVAGSFQAKWLREEWRRGQESRRALFVLMPVTAFVALLIGFALGFQF